MNGINKNFVDWIIYEMGLASNGKLLTAEQLIDVYEKSMFKSITGETSLDDKSKEEIEQIITKITSDPTVKLIAYLDNYYKERFFNSDNPEIIEQSDIN